MKIPEVFYQTRIMLNNVSNDFTTLGDNLEEELSDACRAFLKGKGNNDNLLERTRQLAIDERIALSHYMTGLKIQNFAINAAKNDNLKLNEEINSFLKSYDKITKS